VLSQILWRGVRAQVLARRQLVEEAEKLAREAVTRAESTDFLNHRADALLDLSRVLEASLRQGEAAVAVSEALRLYEAKGNIVAVATTRLRLAELVKM
jgi:hypothetical protein